MKTYYELLGITQAAGSDDVKRAFRREIARYHPDKVQHLGPEFQEIAAERAAELTQAYRVLMDPTARQAYDASVGAGSAVASSRSQPSGQAATAAARVVEPHIAAVPPHAADGVSVPESFTPTQATVSVFVRKATIGRFRESVQMLSGVSPIPAPGFDVACAVSTRRSLFQKSEPALQLLARVVARVDAAAIHDVWPLVMKAWMPGRTVCVLLLGLGMDSSRELASAIAERRRRTPERVPVVIPVDTRDWNALIPPETPAAVRKLLDQLKMGK